MRQVGVQHIPGAKFTKKKFVKSCELCCCSSHCAVLVHGAGSVVVERSSSEIEFSGILPIATDIFPLLGNRFI